MKLLFIYYISLINTKICHQAGGSGQGSQNSNPHEIDLVAYI